MSKEHGAISEKMDLVTFDRLLQLVRKHNVSSFSIGSIAVNLGDNFNQLPPSVEMEPGAAMDEDLDDGMESAMGDSLLHSPLLG